MHRYARRIRSRIVVGIALLFILGRAHAAVGVGDIPATADEGRITVFYPTVADPAQVRRGGFTFPLAIDAAPVRGNGRLVMISHGSGGSAWGHADLAMALVASGFVVAVPSHRGDSFGDSAHPGPDSWTIRPQEVSRAIDAVGRDPRFASLVSLDRVGVYGMSAGGHTALSLAGGRWSPAGFVRHCEVHIADDFPACVGLATQQRGTMWDGLRRWVALAILRHRFADDTPRIDVDPRVAAVVAAVPFAADFDMTSLEHPVVPLALVTARGDRWLNPRFHGDRVLEVCRTCEHLVDVADGGHGALLSPLPPGITGAEGDLLNDPPGFDRARATAMVDDSTVDFFRRQLLRDR
jgi:predicted dienelactone hydrolase